MKKILSFILLFLILQIPHSVFAQKEYSLENDIVVFECEERAVVSCYDGNGSLVYSNIFIPQNGIVKADIPKDFLKMNMRVFEVGKDVVPLTLKESDTSKEYPAVYPSEAEANRAFLVCNNVSLVATDDGEMYKLQCFQKGKATEVLVDTDITINSAPLANYALYGQSAAALKKGDVLRITTNVAKTRVKSIDLMLRAFPETIATNGTDFYDLFSMGGSVGGVASWKVAQFGNMTRDKYRYAFGIVVDKSQHHISLMDNGTSSSEIMEIDIEPETVVYECDVQNKYEFSPKTVADITKTYVRKSVLDGEAVDWSEYKNFTYAFIRIIDSVATDIVYYHNF